MTYDLVIVQTTLPDASDAGFILPGDDGFADGGSPEQEVEPGSASEETISLAGFSVGLVKLNDILQREAFRGLDVAKVKAATSFSFMQRILVEAFECLRSKGVWICLNIR